MAYGNIKRMTAQEHSQRVRFDTNLVERYLPRSGFKKIYPIDPGQGGFAANGDELEDLYAKLEKVSQTVWKKQVGMIQKKEANPNGEKKKKKKGKSKMHLLTSMTFHIVDKTKQIRDDEQEEDPEDGFAEEPEELGNIAEEELIAEDDDKPNRASTMSHINQETEKLETES